MQLEAISDNAKEILDVMRSLIERGETDHLKETPSGWQYRGEQFKKAVDALRDAIQQELKPQGFNVIGCSARHFVKGANILNPLYPQKRILIIPMNGTSALSTGGQIPPNTYRCIEGVPTLYGDNIDVVFVGFEVDNITK
ncbi:uncharacterized protein N7459_006545 [Penicillium hispanicum]|uniref:uncharacterized protein n=1 Tax=Penicillium hispanicum TaxID=1080232 RepID=UPI002540A3AA|nr:uncharacterized protein N7459_006545 [Penicillium hispanicum]KAJ5577581.1 hypothetical protein N7459_006545 [Penicillium hispanicum]